MRAKHRPQHPSHMSLLMMGRTTISSLLIFWSLLLSEGHAFLHFNPSGNLRPTTKCLGVKPKHYQYKSVSTASYLWQTCLHAKKGKKHEDNDGDEPSSYYLDTFSNRNSAIWEERLGQLKDYKEKYGTVNVPYNVNKEDYKDLWGFIRIVRRRQTRVNAEQRAQLDALGFTWVESDVEKQDRKWEKKFLRLVEYQKVHGHCHVPTEFPDDQELANWVYGQRTYYWDKILRKDRIEKLESIGFYWKHKPIPRRNLGCTREQRWIRRYESLKDFGQIHGHFDVSRTDNATKVLEAWVQAQRTRFRLKKLRKDRMELLNEIGFPWSTKAKYDTLWKHSYNQYKEYLHKENGRTTLPKKISSWAHLQRLKNERGTLAPEQRALLDELGFVWTPFVVTKQGEISFYEELWNRKYEELVAFHSIHNHFRVPTSGETKSVNVWLNMQRRRHRKGRLPQNRIDMLNQIGPWISESGRATGNHD